MNWKRPFRPQVVTLKAKAPALCPECQAEIAGAWEAGPAAPKPGGFTICWQCDTFLRFTEQLQLRTLTAEDKRILDMSPGTVKELDQLRITIAVQRSKQA